MTTEEKAKAYDNLLEKASCITDSNFMTAKDVVEHLFPQLAENEDERIRKEIINYLSNELHNVKQLTPRTNEFEAWIAYLEKQKEQEPHYSPLCNTIKDKIREYIANHFITDTVVKTDIKSIVKAMEEGVRLGKEEQEPINECNTHELTLDEARKWNEAYEKGYSLGYENGRNEQKPAEWSEEDEEILDSLIRLYSKEYSADAWPWANGAITYGDVVKFLKSLRPQPHWKPSEEQMEALEGELSNNDYYLPYRKSLTSLFNDLKKLL